jgi:hypothetical protein
MAVGVSTKTATDLTRVHQRQKILRSLQIYTHGKDFASHAHPGSGLSHSYYRTRALSTCSLCHCRIRHACGIAATGRVRAGSSHRLYGTPDLVCAATRAVPIAHTDPNCHSSGF